MKPAPLELAPRLGLKAARPLHRALLARRGDDLTLDASKVEHLGALAVQVIRSAARTWAEDGHVLTIEKASTDLVDQLVLLGFTPGTVTQWEPQE